MDIAHDWKRDRRLPALGVTALVHLLFVLVWQMERRLPPAEPDVARMRVQWLALPALTPRPQAPTQRHAAPGPPAPEATPRKRAPAARLAPAATPAPAAPDVATPDVPAPAVPGPPAESTILDRARREVGSIDRALRKENKPTIVAPPDSTMLRLQKGIEHAAEMAPNAWYQAPKTVELVNNTGDGARRTRVITANRTYCITERAPTTNVEMIEMHGKIRVTTCPEHEEPPKAQAWHDARE